ncbi:MAG: hypothetical protein FJX74_02495 [Armatimonadetes bacterium]|nr:hypothetical protein [Armatimonadota bacterium]
MMGPKWTLTVGVLAIGLSWAAQGQGELTLRPKALADRVTVKEVQNPTAAVWREAPAFRLHLNRTPPLHSDGPRDDGARPTATVRLLRRANGEAFVRLEWTDASSQEAEAGARVPDVGAEHVYQQHTRGASQFADAACIMVPQQRAPVSPGPSITMGDKTNPVDLYYWRAGVGFQVLRAAGLSTVTDTNSAGLGGAARVRTGWTVVFAIGKAPAQTPITFAIWDGAKQHRDGIKYFSLWCEVG